MNLLSYKTYIFDCDGVILNSNRIKADAFHNTVISYGSEKAGKFLDYHSRYGGKSRYEKFDYFIKQIVGRDYHPEEKERLLASFAVEVRNRLLECEIAPGLDKLRKLTEQARWMVVSGGAQEELREVFNARGISGFFDAGIFGSPDNKDEILKREMSGGNIELPAILLGDSKYDYEAASRAGLDFIFIYGWSDSTEEKRYYESKGINALESLAYLNAN